SNGFESMDSLQTAGVRNISAPILTLDGTALAVITCPYITTLGGTAPTRETCEQLIRDAAKRISEVVTGNV
ncbi:hypothetical protein, partial [Pseudomonas fluorescens]